MFQPRQQLPSLTSLIVCLAYLEKTCTFLENLYTVWTLVAFG